MIDARGIFRDPPLTIEQHRAESRAIAVRLLRLATVDHVRRDLSSVRVIDRLSTWVAGFEAPVPPVPGPPSFKLLGHWPEDHV